jgi:hypothetical protein
MLGCADRKGHHWLGRRGDLVSQEGEEPNGRSQTSFNWNEDETARQPRAQRFRRAGKAA